MEKTKVAFVSIFYPLFMGRYILEALLRRDDIEVWTAGPYTGRWIPWAGGMNVAQKHVLAPDFPTAYNPSGPSEINYGLLEKQCPFEPDIWLEVNSTLVTHGRPSTGAYIIVGTDPHVLGREYDVIRPKADIFYSMQRPYMKTGDLWLPYAYDPIWHSQTAIPIEDRVYDCSLIGLHYPQRTHLIKCLRKPNLHPRRGGAGYNCFYDIGQIYDDARDVYHNTVVGLNWSSLLDTTARVFEVMAFGIAPVLNRVPDLMDLFEDQKDFMGFNTEDEAVSIIHALLNDLPRADHIAKQARIAVEPHTWDARAAQILEMRDFATAEESA